MRISDGISDVCSSDLHRPRPPERDLTSGFRRRPRSLTGPAILLEFPPLRTGPGFPGFNMAVTTENQLTITLPDGSTRAFEGPVRSEERRVGEEWGSTCRSRWSPYKYTKTKKDK